MPRHRLHAQHLRLHVHLCPARRLWAREARAAAKDENQADIDRGLVFPLLIERKCLTDIIRRSADASGYSRDGPHFRQERCLRYSALMTTRDPSHPRMHSFLLLEGDLSAFTADQLKPRVGSDEERDLARPDVIAQGYHDVLATFAGVVARNVGSRVHHRVLVLQTTHESSAHMLAALAIVAAHDAADRDTSGYVPFKAFNNDMRWQAFEREMTDLRQTLAQNGIDASFSRLIERRFGSLEALRDALVSASPSLDPNPTRAEKAAADERTSRRGALMLCNLSHGGANKQFETTEEDQLRHNQQAAKVFNLVAPPTLKFHGPPPLLDELLPTCVEVGTSERLHKDLACDDQERYPAYLKFSLLPAALQQAPDLFFLKARKISRKNRLASATLTVVSLPPSRVLGALIDAAERDAGGGGGGSDLSLVHGAWESLRESALPPLLCQAVDLAERKNPGTSEGQVVVLLLEHTKGARERLAKLYNKHRDENGDDEPLMFLPAGYSAAASTRKAAAVRRVDAKSSFLLTLFVAVLSVKGLQVLQTKNRGETEEITTALLHEVHRQALLNRDLD